MLDIRGGFMPLAREARPRSRSLSSMWDLLGVLWYQRWLVTGIAALFLAAGIGYVVTAQRLYNATASLLIDTRQDDPLQKQRSSDAQTETTAIESQAQLLTSDAIAVAVVRRLELAKDPEFIEDNSSLLMGAVRRAIAWTAGSDDRPPTEQELERTAMDRLVGSLTVGRVGRTYVVNVSALSRDPAKAARIANAVTHAYTDDQLNARLAAADRSADWLRTRASELRRQSLDADRAVQEYTSQSNRERVELRALETTAQTYRTLFETFLQQYATTLQQQTFPINYARVITPAKPPTRKSQPRTSLVLLGSLLGGLGLGWLAGFARESVYPKLRLEREVEQVTGLRSIGILPEIVQNDRRLLRRLQPTRDSGWLKPRHGSKASRLVGRTSALLQIVRLYPLSRFANAVKNVRVALDLTANGHRAVKTVGIISAQPGEGKSVLAANLAQHLAKVGARTILLDLDFQKPTLTDATPRTHSAGLHEVAFDRVPVDEALFVDEESGLTFLPNSAFRHGANMAETLASPAFKIFVDQLRDRFDYIVVDLPCLDTIIEARAVATVVDGVVLICAAGRTRTDTLAPAMDRWEAAGLSPILGFVLNRVRVRHPIGSPAAPNQDASGSQRRQALPDRQTVT